MTAEEKKVLRMLVRMQDDDIRDVERMASQAEVAREAGMEGLAQRIAAKAKARAREFDEEGKELAEFLGNPKAVGDPDSAYALCLNEMLVRQKEKFRQALARVQAL